MTNEGLKKKIIEILEETEYEWTEERKRRQAGSRYF